ncbi:hypothetical protein DL89DRAFT_140987 [Linderina pennispora]|uniref:Uncharacterized protein n=1 Tax=Linderina pennispora TaxID=61395 RepID=A0A1Y1WBA1_9FUNG|nr:uncharacterized protein DL89DRAFT_140987 [Linderina pennispora]ORX70811.1 hypothetical protein DL89DRAFT_140987 [Linderina pennispora]
MSAWLDSLSGEFRIGFLVSSAAFNVIFHSIRYQGALTTEKQLAWILTFTTCVVVTTGSLPYVATLIASGFDVSKIVYTDTFSQMLIGPVSCVPVLGSGTRPGLLSVDNIGADRVHPPHTIYCHSTVPGCTWRISHFRLNVLQRAADNRPGTGPHAQRMAERYSVRP